MNQGDLERIEAYILGEMPIKTRQAFEQEMAGDQKLTAAVAEQRKFINGVQEHVFRDILEEIHQESNSLGQKPRWEIMKPLWGIAAAVLILIGSFWLWPKQNNLAEINPIILDPGLPTLLGQTNSVDFGEGMNAYKLKDYGSARTYWEPLLKNQPSNDTLLFYLAQIDFAQKNTKEAIAKLEILRDQNTSPFHQKSIWYLALGKLEMGQIDEAKVVLKEISTSQNNYTKRAKELLEVLNNL